MAANPYKTEIINMAITVLREGRTSVAGQFHSPVDDSVFADYTTAGTKDLERAVFQYPLVLKEVIRDIQPDFATQYEDLNEEILINKEIADFSYLFELPSDFLDIIAQVNEADRKAKYDNEIMLFDSYAHVVKGTDDQAWKCKLAHTAADANKPTTGASYATNWELYNTDGTLGAVWVTAWSYKASQDGRLLATNEYSNADGDSAYIKYLAYAYAGISDKPQYYPDAFKRAFAVRLASALTKDVKKQTGLLLRYDKYEKPEVWDNKDKKRYKGVITKNRTIAVARENLQIK